MAALNEKALLPCPFCGGAAAHHDIGNSYTKSRATKIWCSECFFSKTVRAIRHDLDWTRAKAIEAWDRRAAYRASEPDAVAVEREAAMKKAELVRDCSGYRGTVANCIEDLDRARAVAVADRDHWKANHDNMAARNAVLRDRPDLPVDRLPALARIEARAEKAEKERDAAVAEIDRLRAALLKLAPHHQGAHSPCGMIISEALGIPFPLRQRDIAALSPRPEQEKQS